MALGGNNQNSKKQRSESIMKFASRIFLICLMIFGFTINFSGCAYGLTDCSKYAGTGEYNQCLASNGDQQMQYELGLAAYEAADTDAAIKWLEMAAKPRDNRTPIFIPNGNNGDVRIELQETGLSKPGHYGAQELLDKIYEGNR